MSEPGPASLATRLAAVRVGIGAACARAGRRPEDVRLVAVTKTVPLEVVREARDLGVQDFGENRASELATKAQALPATWHFLGKLQRGTSASVASHADLIHSAEPGEGLERVAGRARREGRTIPCLVQVDFTGRRQGVAPEGLRAFVARAAALEGILVTGLMTLPPWTGDPGSTRPYFARLRELGEGLRADWPSLVDLSMGMSGDYEVGIEEGATMVRVGTALFGERRISPAP